MEESSFNNMKELRFQFKGSPWRILFVFDLLRKAILLVGGNKQGNKRWYKENIPIADKRFKDLQYYKLCKTLLELLVTRK
ncbi:MAG: type II toxin-antitoxin system RelE/ParE family toxin [Calothrix sp. C42_A2020_038]|nr:type II toxin-antitoxin system RelE/ParE family toxin [Calothrix sp. C42_A2020_038]